MRLEADLHLQLRLGPAKLTADTEIFLYTVSNRTDTAPEATAFLKELLVPGSTK